MLLCLILAIVPLRATLAKSLPTAGEGEILVGGQVGGGGQVKGRRTSVSIINYTLHRTSPVSRHTKPLSAWNWPAASSLPQLPGDPSQPLGAVSRVICSGKPDLTCTETEVTQPSFGVFLPGAEHASTLTVTQIRQSLSMSLLDSVGVSYVFVSLSSVGTQCLLFV